MIAKNRVTDKKFFVQSELNLAQEFRGAALGAIIADRREQKLLEQDELILSDDEDDDTIEDEQIIIKNWYIPFLFIFFLFLQKLQFLGNNAPTLNLAVRKI